MIPDEEIKHDAKKSPVEHASDAEKKSMRRIFKPVIDMKKCTKCMICVAVCPENTITVAKEAPLIEYPSCTGCLICLRECPYSAIAEEREI